MEIKIGLNVVVVLAAVALGAIATHSMIVPGTRPAEKRMVQHREAVRMNQHQAAKGESDYGSYTTVARTVGGGSAQGGSERASVSRMTPLQGWLAPTCTADPPSATRSGEGGCLADVSN